MAARNSGPWAILLDWMNSGWRRYTTDAFTVGAAGVGPLLVSFGFDAGQKTNWWLVAAGSGLIVIAIVAQLLRSVASHLQEKNAERATAQTIKGFKDALHPVLEATANLAYLSRRQDRETVLAGLAQQIVGILSSFMFQDRQVRAVLYLIDANGMYPEAYAGRSGVTPNRFDAGTQRGDEALAMVQREGHVHIRDNTREDPALYAGSAAGYTCFISVGVHTLQDKFGMLTVDTPIANAFDDVDVEFVQLMADVAAMAIALSKR